MVVWRHESFKEKRERKNKNTESNPHIRHPPTLSKRKIGEDDARKGERKERVLGLGAFSHEV